MGIGIQIASAVGSLALGVVGGAAKLKASGATFAASNDVANAAELEIAASVRTAQAAVKAQAQAKKSYEYEKEANTIAGAAQSIASADQRRQKVRELRIRRASMLAASENSGGAGGSAEGGAQGALTSSFNAIIGQANTQTKANHAINVRTQLAANYDFAAKMTNTNAELDMMRARVGTARAQVKLARAQAGQGKADAFADFLGVFQQGFSSLGSISR